MLGVLLGLLVLGCIVSALAGQLPIRPGEVVGAALHGVGIDTSLRPDSELVEQTLLQIRFPRVVMSLAVGAALAIGGTVMQAIFGNPLAEPGVVGVSAGSALGAAIVIAIGAAGLGGWAVAVAAFIGGLLATLLVYVSARGGGRTQVVTLLLTGIAVNAFAGAGLALVLFLAKTASREQIIFWQLGSMNGSRWSEVLVVLIVTAIATAVAIGMARQYDLLALGERTAGHLGLRVERLRATSIVLVALLTGAAVAFTGIISFVGLVVPHIMRMLLGPAHRLLLIASLLAGATLLVWADLIARVAVAGSDLPIGLLTSLIGGPFFFYLVHVTRRQSGGWG